MYRPRLWHIKTEKDLWDYFEENAGYDESMQIYQCAGVVSDDTRKLWLKLIEEWKKDKKDHTKEMLRKDA